MEKTLFNISTLSSFITAGAGCNVTKHGNYGVSSSCGSSNVLESLGVKFTNDIDYLKRSLKLPIFVSYMLHYFIQQ